SRIPKLLRLEAPADLHIAFPPRTLANEKQHDRSHRGKDSYPI
ncbi:MAG: hypothetical protein ACI9MB_001407, partial [Verrucomicrobiales bacterium]